MSAIAHRIGAVRCWLIAPLLLLMALATLGSPPVRAAQIELVRSDPQAGSIVASSPLSIQLSFSEALEVSASSVRVLDIDGAPVPGLTSSASSDRQTLVIPVPQSLDNGAYTVAWNVTSAAGDSALGSFTFTIGSQVDIASVAVPVIEPAAGPLWLQAVARWLVLLTVAIAIAAWPVWLIVLWPGARNTPAQIATLGQRAQSLGLAASAAAILANLFALVTEATTRPGGSLPTRIGDTLFETRFGRLWLARVGLLLLLALALRCAPWAAPLGRRYLSAVVVLISLAAAAPYSLDSYASALSSGRWTAFIFDVVHLISAAFWFGGLVALIAVVLGAGPDPAGRRRLLAQALPRFSAMALVCWGMLGVSGLYAWWLQVGSWDALRFTDYGKALLAKLVLAGAVLLIALLNHRFITRKLAEPAGPSPPSWSGRLGYAVIAEIVLTSFILLAVGRMATLPPARDVLDAERVGQTVHFTLDNRNVRLTFAPGAAGTNHFLVTLPDDDVPLGAQAFLRFTYLDQEIGSTDIELGRSSLTTFETHGSQFGLVGAWDIGLTLRLPDAPAWTDTQSIAIDATGSPAPGEPWQVGTGGAIGLLLFGLAITGFAFAWRAGKGRLRMETAGIGAAAAVLGLMVTVQGRFQPGDSYYLGLTNPIAASNDSITRGSALYQANCLSCHGAAGEGDGPLAAGMFPQPANFLAPHTRVHADGQLFEWIRNGKPNTDMPAFPQLTDEQIWDLVNYIQVEFQGEPKVEGTPPAAVE